ncbi:hypothetical protein ACIBI9_31375 [Nonomuraea sp. NPDC050451]|uniref:hypothetical protein n=1 Tax=Nonomuraea sp. NPDC050451 TaxID=3364364 RepID=UPI00378A1D18
MNREEKQALAGFIIGEVGTLFEFWSEKIVSDPQYETLKGIDPQEAAQAVANWLGRLPGATWTQQLPLPTYCQTENNDA